MKDLFDYALYDTEAKNYVLTHTMVCGNSIKSSSMDDYLYRCYQRMMGEKEVRGSETVFYKKSEMIYDELQEDKLLKRKGNSLAITRAGKVIAKLGYGFFECFRSRVYLAWIGRLFVAAINHIEETITAIGVLTSLIALIG